MANDFANELASIAQRLTVLASQLNTQAPTIPAGALGTTASDWQAPPSPWPIDARFLSAEQIAKLDADATFRANYWQQSLMSAAMAGNGKGPVPAALAIYRLFFVSDPKAKLTDQWKTIFDAYGVPYLNE